MVVAKRQGREKPTKIEERKVRGLECEPQVEQTAILASLIYIGQAQGLEKKKNVKRRAKGLEVTLSFCLCLSFSLFYSRLLCRHALMP